VNSINSGALNWPSMLNDAEQVKLDKAERSQVPVDATDNVLAYPVLQDNWQLLPADIERSPHVSDKEADDETL